MRRRCTRRSQPRDRRRARDLPGHPRSDDHAAPHPRGVARALRPGHRVRDRPHHDGRQHRHLPRQPVPPLRRRRRPREPAARDARRRARRGVPADRCRERGIPAEVFLDRELAGTAVLLHTGWSRHFGRPEYAHGSPFLTEAGAQHLADAGVAIVGIDALNIDDTESGGTRPAHSILLAAGIHVVEHLTASTGFPCAGRVSPRCRRASPGSARSRCAHSRACPKARRGATSARRPPASRGRRSGIRRPRT